MVTLIGFYQPCAACGGTGVRKYNATSGGPLVEESPCPTCGGTGAFVSTTHGMDDTLIQQILTNQTTILSQLSYIHGKVTAIWNQVKPG